MIIILAPLIMQYFGLEAMDLAKIVGALLLVFISTK